MNSIHNFLRGKLRERISLEIEGISHGLWHLDRVHEFACQLQSLYGGDLSIITAAVYLHDLGRSDTTLHGQDSIEKSLEYANKILEDISYPTEKRAQVLLAIDEHDKPKTRPSSLEGRILKDADFLAGFGAVGVLRIALWTVESGENVEGIFDRLGYRMMDRFRGLEFPESEAWANREVAFARLFLSQLNIPPVLKEYNQPGKYIIFEGISGTGKDTQIKLLKTKLQEIGYPTKIVREPADDYKEIRRLWKKRHNGKLNDPFINTLFLMADRYDQIRQKIRPAITRGDIVISNRSYISNLVYQCDSDDEIATAIFAHKFVPIPDLIIYYDIEPDKAFDRIKNRKTVGMYEKIDLMKLHRERYVNLFKSGVFGKRVKTIDATQSLSDVAEQTLKLVEDFILKNNNKL